MTNERVADEAVSLSAEVGRRLRERRHERGETLESVAGHADVSPAHLAEIETGKSFCSLPVLLRLSHALDYPMTEILPSLGGPRVRTGAVGSDTAGVEVLSHGQLDLTVTALRMDQGDQRSMRLGRIDSLVYVVAGACAVDTGAHRAELSARDSADIAMADDLVITAVGASTVLVAVGPDRFSVGDPA